MNRLLIEIEVIAQRFEVILPALFGRSPFPPGNLALLDVVGTSYEPALPKPFSIKDFIGDGFLWAVPRTRRTVERRMKRRFSNPEQNDFVKQLLRKTNLQVCDTCGNHKEIGILCAHCYARVLKETEEIKDKILAKLKLQPIESDVVVLYEGERRDGSEEFWKGKRIVEMDKPRPQWFGKNLLQKTTQQNAETKTVKPDELG